MKKIIIDCHNHTKGSKYDQNIKGSDGVNYVEDFAREAIEKNLTMCAITEHDVVNRKLKELLKNEDIIVPEAVEISAKNYTRGKALHILYYANTISEEVDRLVEGVSTNKNLMLLSQIKLLKDKGFKVEIEEVREWMKNFKLGEDALNKWTIAQTLFKGPKAQHNLENLVKLFGNNKDGDWFFENCLKSTGKFYDEFKIEDIEYESDLEDISKFVKKDNAILSIAHPNFTFKKGIEEFKKELPYYIEAGINSIEINALASKEWIEEIQRLKRKYDLILTFGSDCHQIGVIDDKHSTFGTMNSFLNDEIIKENYQKFRDRIGI